jgi:hypothetical protein
MLAFIPSLAPEEAYAPKQKQGEMTVRIEGGFMSFDLT